MALVPVKEAQERILKSIRVLAAEEVALDKAIGRSLAQPVTAVRDLPPWDNSAMDGYALRSLDAQTPGATLRVVETIFAGDTPKVTLTVGTCARIMTGAQLPPGADAVIMQEKVELTESGSVRLLEALQQGANVRRRGEDTSAGQTMFQVGRQLQIADAGVLWAQGATTVSAHRRPRVSIVTSGDELVELGSADTQKIIDTNGPVLACLAKRAGAVATHVGRAHDSLESMTALFRKGLKAEVLITVAGASVGERDFTREALRNLEVDIDFWKVAMKPGKPLAVGRRGDTLVFGLPGNPVSALVTFELFVVPALRALQGQTPFVKRLHARTTVDLQKPAGLRHFIRATWEARDGALWATPVPLQSSGALMSAAAATCLIELPEELTMLQKSSTCELIPVSWASAW